MAEPTIQFALVTADGFGAITGWNKQDANADAAKDRAASLSEIGNETASKVTNETTKVTSNYKAAAAGSAPALPTTIGALVNSLILESVSIDTKAQDFAGMALSGHNHTTNAHADTLLQAALSAYTLDDGFGVTDFLEGTAGDNASAQSGSLQISLQHVDEVDEGGDHLIGNNYNCTVTATTEWCGVPTTAAAAGWDNVSVKTVTGNTGHKKTTVTGVQTLALALPT
jgi:hypothetical protein